MTYPQGCVSRYGSIAFRTAAGGGNRARYNTTVPAVRLVYSAAGLYRFASHLDIAEELTRLVRRTGFDTLYSEGFNPRPKMSLCPPKPVGVSVDADIADIALESLTTAHSGSPVVLPPETSALRQKSISIADCTWFNEIAEMAEIAISKGGVEPSADDTARALFDTTRARTSPGFEIRAMRVLGESEPHASGVIASAVYFIRLENPTAALARQAEHWLLADEWWITKKIGMPDVDIRRLVNQVHAAREGKTLSVGIIGKSCGGETLPVMKAVSKLVREFGSIPMDVIRTCFLNVDGKVCV